MMAILIISFYLSNHRWYRKLVNSVARAANLIVRATFLSIVITVRAIPGLLVKGAKAGAIAAFTMLLTIVYVLSSVAPFVGKYTEGIGDWAGQHQYPRSLAIRGRKVRDMLVKIAAETGRGELRFSEPTHYTERLAEVKGDGKKRLETGELALSLVLGAVLIGSQAAGIDVFNLTLYGLRASIFIELWLLVIAVSVVIRVSVVESLSYAADYDFDSIEEMDAALGYQKGLPLGSFQIWVILMTVVWTVSSVQDDVVEKILAEKFGNNLSVPQTLKLLWRELSESN